MNFGNDLKEAYRKRNIIATPLKVNEAPQNSLLIEEAINITLLDDTDTSRAINDHRYQPETLDNVERPTHSEHHQRNILSIDDLVGRIEAVKNSEQSILVTGRAGIGKSILCQLIAYRWAKNQILRNIPAIIWLPLKSIEQYGKHTRLDEWITQLYFEGNSKHKERITQLIERGELRNCLFILDGYDEIENVLANRLAIVDLFKNYPKKLVTTRPHSRPDFIDGFKVNFHTQVENIGFKDSDISLYINKFFRIDEIKRATLIQYIDNNPGIRSACHIPINLFMLCHLWMSAQRPLLNGLNYNKLYEKFINAILSKSQIKTINKSTSSLYKDYRNYDERTTEADHSKHILAISHIAFQQSMSARDVHIEKALINEILAEISSGLSITDIIDTGLIKPSFTIRNVKTGLQPHFYSFLHYTFQEYFTANYLNKSIESTNIDLKTKTLRYISKNKYNPSFSTTLCFLIGMTCHQFGNEDAMNALWDALLVHDLDMIGLKHQELMISALEASSGDELSNYGLPKEKVDKIHEDIFRWVTFSIEPPTKNPSMNKLKDKAKAVLTRGLMNSPMLSTGMLPIFKKHLEEPKNDRKSKLDIITTYLFAMSNTNIHAAALIQTQLTIETMPTNELLWTLRVMPWDRCKTINNFNDIINQLFKRFNIEIEQGMSDEIIRELMNVVRDHHNEETRAQYDYMVKAMRSHERSLIKSIGRFKRPRKLDNEPVPTQHPLSFRYARDFLRTRILREGVFSTDKAHIINMLLTHCSQHFGFSSVEIQETLRINPANDFCKIINASLSSSNQDSLTDNALTQALHGCQKLVDNISAKVEITNLLQITVINLPLIWKNKFITLTEVLVALKAFMTPENLLSMLDFIHTETSKPTPAKLDEITSILRILNAYITACPSYKLATKIHEINLIILALGKISRIQHTFHKEKRDHHGYLMSIQTQLNALTLSANLIAVKKDKQCYREVKELMIITLIASKSINDNTFESLALWLSDDGSDLTNTKTLAMVKAIIAYSTDESEIQNLGIRLYRLMRIIEPSSMNDLFQFLSPKNKRAHICGTPNVLMEAQMECIIVIITENYPHLITSLSEELVDLEKNQLTKRFSTKTYQPINLVKTWILLVQAGISPPQAFTRLLRSKLELPGRILPSHKTEVRECLETLILSGTRANITTSPEFISLLILLKGSIDGSNCLKCINSLINTVAHPETKPWNDLLQAIIDLADGFNDDPKYEIIINLLSAANGTENEIKVTDRYVDIINAAKSIFEKLSLSFKDHVRSFIHDNLESFSETDRLALIYVLWPRQTPSTKVFNLLSRLLDHKEVIIAALATSLILKMSQVETRYFDEETLFYLSTKIYHGNQAEITSAKNQLQLWLRQSPGQLLSSCLKTGFYHRNIFETLSPLLEDFDISINDLILIYIDFLNNLNDSHIVSLFDRKTYLFDMILHSLTLNGYTLQGDQNLNQLQFSDYSSINTYKFQTSTNAGMDINNREQAILILLLNESFKLLKRHGLPTAQIGSLIKHEMPRFEQASKINFFDDYKLDLWRNAFIYSPYLVKNTPLLYRDNFRLAVDSTPKSHLIRLTTPGYNGAIYLRPYNRLDTLKIKLQPHASLHAALIAAVETIHHISEIRYLDLSDNNLCDADIDALLDPFIPVENIRALILSNNHLTEAALDIFLSGRFGQPYTDTFRDLQYLFLDNNYISFNENNARSFSPAISSIENLIHIDLSCNFLPANPLATFMNRRKADAPSARPLKWTEHDIDLHHPSPIDNIAECRHPALYSQYRDQKLRSLIDPTEIICKHKAVVSFIAKKPMKMFPLSLMEEHAYLIIEDIDTLSGQRRIIRADLFTPDSTSIEFVLCQLSMSEFNQIKPNDQNIKSYNIDPSKVTILIQRILDYQRNQKIYNYAYFFDRSDQELNCSKWVINLLRAIDIDITKESIFPSKQFSPKMNCTIS